MLRFREVLAFRGSEPKTLSGFLLYFLASFLWPMWTLNLINHLCKKVYRYFYCIHVCMYPQGCLKNQSIQTLHSFHPYFSHFVCLKLAYSMPGQPSFGCQPSADSSASPHGQVQFMEVTEAHSITATHAQHLQNLTDLLQLRKIMGWFLFQRKSAKISQGVCLSLFVYILFHLVFCSFRMLFTGFFWFALEMR